MFTLIISVISLGFILERWLNYLNLKNQDEIIPEELKGVYDNDVYKKSLEYERANSKFGNSTSTLSFLITVILISTGFFAKLDDWSKAMSVDLVWSTILFFGLLAFFSDLIGIPFALYKTFVIY